MTGMKSFTNEQLAVSAQLEHMFPWYLPNHRPNIQTIVSIYDDTSREVKYLSNIINTLEYEYRTQCLFSSVRASIGDECIDADINKILLELTIDTVYAGCSISTLHMMLDILYTYFEWICRSKKKLKYREHRKRLIALSFKYETLDDFLSRINDSMERYEEISLRCDRLG